MTTPKFSSILGLLLAITLWYNNQIQLVKGYNMKFYNSQIKNTKHKNLNKTPTLSDDVFFNKIVIPYHYQIAINNSYRFGIKNINEKTIICSNDYATSMGYNEFTSAMNKTPDIDYKRRFGSYKDFNKQLNYLQDHKKSFHYTLINN